MISAKELKAECLRRKYLELLERPDTFPSAANWAYIIQERMHGLGPALYRKFLVAGKLDEDKRSVLHTAALRHFPEYLKAVDRAEALSTVYGDRHTSPDTFISLVIDCQLFDAARIKEIIDGGEPADLHVAARLLEAFQPEYDNGDLLMMRRLRESLRQLPPLGRIEERRGLLGLSRKYVCPCGHVNDASSMYCDECGLDIRGLSRDDEDSVEQFDRTVDTLAEMLENKL